MIGKLIARDAPGIALIDFGKHRRIPGVPVVDEPIVHRRQSLLQVRPLHRILDDVEEEAVVEELQELVIAVASGALGIRLEAPEQFSRYLRSARKHWQQVDAGA